MTNTVSLFITKVDMVPKMLMTTMEVRGTKESQIVVGPRVFFCFTDTFTLRLFLTLDVVGYRPLLLHLIFSFLFVCLFCIHRIYF